MTLPLASIVIPTYKQPQYVPICIDAAWFQDYPNLEIIVVNAASPDNTAEVLSDYEAHVKSDVVSYAKYYNETTGIVERFEHPRYPKEGRSLKIINLKEDPGLSETYNIGIRESTGKYVTPIVSDDIPYPSMVSKLVTALEAGHDFAYGDAFIVDDAGRIIRQFKYPDYDPKTCLADWYLMGSARMWRRELHDKGLWFSSEFPIVQDYELILRFAMNGAKFIHVPEVLYSVRWHGPSRKTGNHTAEREPAIFTESMKVARIARAWLASKSND